MKSNELAMALKFLVGGFLVIVVNCYAKANGCAEFDTDPFGPCNGKNKLLYNGHEYQLVEIGGKCWFGENLQSNRYANGDYINGNLSPTGWLNTRSGAQAVYGENGEMCGSVQCNAASNLENYGRLYNWYAVNDARGLCPSGWHVPTDIEWMNLEEIAGLTSNEAQSVSWRGSRYQPAIGMKLKSSTFDVPKWNGTNQLGFKALPSGRRNYDGEFTEYGMSCYFWTSSEKYNTDVNLLFVDFAWFRYMDDGGGINRAAPGQGNGFSVRCVSN